jgi:ribosomal protein S18 acetylase RimI-like enzyme
MEGNMLAGVAVLGNRPICDDDVMLQMIFLHVSQNHRRKGIAHKLVEEIVKVAKERGAERLYISATPSDSAIGFYISMGCKLAPKVDKELYAKEPEDIHFVFDL